MPLDNPLVPSPEEMDIGKRISDAVNLHLISAPDVLEHVGRWTAFHLETGEELDAKATYETKEEAIYYAMPREHEYAYMELTPDGITPANAVRFLRICRHPMVDNVAPVWVTNRALFPRFSNLTSQQRKTLKAEAERQAKENG